MVFDINFDGLMCCVYVQLSNFNGFGVLDFEIRKEVICIEYLEVLIDQQIFGYGGNTVYGIGVILDNKYLVVNSSLNSSVYVYMLFVFELVGGVCVGYLFNWMMMIFDSKFVYVFLLGSNSVVVVDIVVVKMVVEIKIGGQVSKWNVMMIVKRQQISVGTFYIIVSLIFVFVVGLLGQVLSVCDGIFIVL